MTIWDVTPTRTRVVPRMRTVQVAIYGNRWCGITQLIRRALDRAGIGYDSTSISTNIPPCTRAWRR